MDYKYPNQAEGAYKNYYQDQKYQQPATQSAAYQHEGNTQTSSNYGGQYQDGYNYDNQYQDPGVDSQYTGVNYDSGTAEPSLSDYNSHESCIKISSKK